MRRCAASHLLPSIAIHDALLLLVAGLGLGAAPPGPTAAGAFPALRPIAARPALPTSPEPSATAQVALEGLVPAHDALVLALAPATRTLRVVQGVGEPLTDAARQALAVAPSWVRPALARNLAALPAAVQDRYAPLLLDPGDPRLLDELAFCLAHVAPEDLQGGRLSPEALLANAAWIYRLDPHLDHVRLVDLGAPGVDPDYGTTAAYQVLEEGVLREWELAPELYYWWVVHPRLQDELPGWVDPGTGTLRDPPRGVLWRSYLWEGDPESLDYREHLLLGLPELVTEDRLQGWGPSAVGHFPPGAYPFPLRLVRDVTRPDEPAVLVEFAWEAGRVVATTLTVEQHASSGLLANLVQYGPGNVSLDRFADRVLVLSARPADAVSLQPLLAALDRARLDFALLTPEAFATLSAADLAEYRKLIVPEGEPVVVLSALEEARATVESWLAAGRVLEVHAFDPADPWCAQVVLPGGLTCAAGETDTVRVEGWPSLRQFLAEVSVLWDGVAGSKDGDRWPAAGDTALDRVGAFVGQNLLDNVAEMAAKALVVRSVQPAAILYHHFGNCGELQDLLTAAGRTALLPVMNVSNSHEDHVWNEVAYRDRWLPWQDSWSDGGTVIDDPGVSASTRWGGGKDNSFVTGDRGDTWQLDRTGAYARSFPYRVTVQDAAGQPVDGALVVLYSEAYYPEADGSYPLYPGRWGFTDRHGQFHCDLGEQNAYYLTVLSRAGQWPADRSAEFTEVEEVLTPAQAVAGEARSVAVQLPDAIVRPAASLLSGEAAAAVPSHPELRLAVRLQVGEEVVRARHWAYGTTFDEALDPQGVADLYLTDAAGLSAYQADEPFAALRLAEALQGEHEFIWPVPGTGEWYLVVSGKSRAFLRPHVTLQVTLQDVSGEGEGEGGGVGGGGEGE
ncbi:MAG: hypothetical protein RBU45_09675, partial [Myxococcota bacterium]|nr:hypothetical protein [Myxococcota bacterium]